MPVLNEGDLAGLRGVLDQDYPGDVELVLALGPSHDGTASIAAALAAARDPQVR